MTAARESFRDPPLIICDGRLLIYPDGEIMCFMRDGRSWTTAVLDGRDIAELRKYMPTLEDNIMHMWEDTK